MAKIQQPPDAVNFSAVLLMLCLVALISWPEREYAIDEEQIIRDPSSNLPEESDGAENIEMKKSKIPSKTIFIASPNIFEDYIR